MLGALVRSLLKPPQPTRCAAEIDRWLVPSWTIAAIGYHAETQILQVEYTSGFIYEADNVSQAEYDHLWEAQDFGKAFGDTILTHYQLHQVAYQHPIFLG